MSIGTPPLKSNLPAGRELAIWTQPWAAWFTSLWQSVFGWKKTYTATLTHDFGSISAQSQATQTVTVTGVRLTDDVDFVVVRPKTAVNGIIMDGTVTADDTVTVRAVNYSSGPINPDSQIYRVIVFQQ